MLQIKSQFEWARARARRAGLGVGGMCGLDLCGRWVKRWQPIKMCSVAAAKTKKAGAVRSQPYHAYAM